MKIHQAFQKVRESIKLDPVEYASSIATHNLITEQLKAAGLIVGAFLQGSLARKTMISPLRDIDKVILLVRDFRQVPNGQQIAADEVAALLRRLYPDNDVEIGTHCVTIDFGFTTFKFDIVPAIDLGDDVEIINTKKGCWQVSNTRELIRVVQQRNKACDGNFVHQARIGKLFVRHTIEGLVPGLHVEAFAFEAITQSMEDDEAIAALLNAGSRALAAGAAYTDPTGVDELGHRLDPPARAQAHVAFAEAAALANAAVAHRRAGDDNAAIAIWHKLLGDDFPKPDATAALVALGSAAGVSQQGVITSGARVRPTPTRSWRP